MSQAPNGAKAAWALEMRGVTKQFPGTLAVDHVDFRVKKEKYML